MAKSTKKAGETSRKKTAAAPPIKKDSLMATASSSSFPVTINISFLSGLGQATAILFRKGLLINMQSVSVSSDIQFTDVESGDAFAVNGICAAKATVTINVNTNPTTPEQFSEFILGSYLVD